MLDLLPSGKLQLRTEGGRFFTMNELERSRKGTVFYVRTKLGTWAKAEKCGDDDEDAFHLTGSVVASVDAEEDEFDRLAPDMRS